MGTWGWLGGYMGVAGWVHGAWLSGYMVVAGWVHGSGWVGTW